MPVAAIGPLLGHPLRTHRAHVGFRATPEPERDTTGNDADNTNSDSDDYPDVIHVTSRGMAKAG